MIDTVSSVSNIAFTDKDDVKTRETRWVFAKMDMLGVFQVVGSCDYKMNIVLVCVELCNIYICIYICIFNDALEYTLGQLKKITFCLILLWDWGDI